MPRGSFIYMAGNNAVIINSYSHPSTIDLNYKYWLELQQAGFASDYFNLCFYFILPQTQPLTQSSSRWSPADWFTYTLLLTCNSLSHSQLIHSQVIHSVIALSLVRSLTGSLTEKAHPLIQAPRALHIHLCVKCVCLCVSTTVVNMW